MGTTKAAAIAVMPKSGLVYMEEEPDSSITCGVASRSSVDNGQQYINAFEG